MISREGLRPLSGDKQEREKRPGLAAALKQQFRAAVKAITKPEPEEKPQKRKGKDETGSMFKMAARKILRRASRLPIEAYSRAAGYLADTLDWLNQWQQEESLEDDVQYTQDHLYPHL